MHPCTVLKARLQVLLQPYLAVSHWHKLLVSYPALLTGQSTMRLLEKAKSDSSVTKHRKTKRPVDGTNEKHGVKDTHTQLQRTASAPRRATLEKASSLLLPRQRNLLGNCVAMARVSSVMQTWPHPLMSAPAVKSKGGFYCRPSVSIWRSEKLCTCVFVWCAFLFV